MLNKPLTDVLVQGHYMSGDRNTIASALEAFPKLGVLILGPEGNDARTAELAKLYMGIAPKRVEVCEIIQGSHKTPLDAVKAAYQQIAEYTRDRKKPLPTWITRHVNAPAVVIQPAPYATGLIASGFMQRRGPKTQAAIRKLWRLPGDPEAEGTVLSNVASWLGAKGFTHNRAYVFLFAKQGARTAEKAHHFTSILTWRLLAERIARDTHVIPVCVGDDIGLRTTPTLVEFWKDPAWIEIFSTTTIDARCAQLGMWCYLAEMYEGVSIVGMRSGMIEVPGLLGIRTMYLEEAHNDQANRMIQWADDGNGKGVPGWTRQVVNRPPGIAQQIYWRQDGMKNSEKSNVRQHVEKEGEHVQGLVYGSKNPLETAKLVFGRDALAGSLVPADKFQLSTNEFDSIVKWVAQTPIPKGATGSNVNGSVHGCLQKRDVAALDHSALKQEKSWSEYFASSAYRNTLPALSWKTMA